MQEIERINELEIKLAHAERQLEELNGVVAGHSTAVDRLERRVAMLMQRAAQQDADGATGVVTGHEQPPHW